MQLSKRLTVITDMVLPCGTLADIGCDHGFVSISLIERGICGHVIASDLGEGPLAAARQHVAAHGLEEKIELRRGDGLGTLNQTEAEAAVIAGMGGKLMCRILTEHAGTVKNFKFMVLSAHREMEEVRDRVYALGFEIAEEAMVFEDGKYYPVLRAEKNASGKTSLTEIERYFGPRLLEHPTDTFILYLEDEKKRAESIIGKTRGSGKSPAAREACEAARRKLSLTEEALLAARISRQGELPV